VLDGVLRLCFAGSPLALAVLVRPLLLGIALVVDSPALSVPFPWASDYRVVSRVSSVRLLG
jgi:hypothetical protein